MITLKTVMPLLAIPVGFGIVDFFSGYMPVVVSMKAEQVSFTNGHFIAQITGRKVKDCLWVAGTDIGWHFADGRWFESPVSYPDDMTPDSSRPAWLGLQDFGLFEWSGVPDGATLVGHSVMHDCGGELVVTTSGPFKINNEVTE